MRVLCFPKDNQSHWPRAVLEDRLSAATVPPQQHPVGGQPAPFPGAAEGGVGEEEEGAGGQEAGQGQVQPQPAPRAHSGHEADAAGGGGDKEQQRGGVWVDPKDIFLPSHWPEKVFFISSEKTQVWRLTLFYTGGLGIVDGSLVLTHTGFSVAY